jgi:hypothetical protein
LHIIIFITVLILMAHYALSTVKLAATKHPPHPPTPSLMSISPPIQPQFIHVGQGFFPYPATKLVVTQFFHLNRGDPAFWAWIIVGVFYDRDGNPIWSTKVRARQVYTEEIHHEGESESGGGVLSGQHPVSPTCKSAAAAAACCLLITTVRRF